MSVLRGAPRLTTQLRLIGWFAILLSAAACGKKSETVPSPPAPVSSTSSPSVEQFDRVYTGTIGGNLHFTMQLHRDGSALTGTYAYAHGSGSIDLHGLVTADDAFELTESSAGTTTGHFSGRLGDNGSMSGTWTDAKGSRTLPLLASIGGESATSVPAQAAVTTPRKAVEAASEKDWSAFYSAIARMNGVNVTESEVDAAVRDRFKSSFNAFKQKIKAPFTDIAALYLADINNDGASKYVLCDTNSVGMHNSRVVGVYRPQGAGLVEIPLPAAPPFSGISFLGNPFLSVDAEGTTMTEKRGRFVWKGSAVRLLGR